MTDYLRLRRIGRVGRKLEPVTADMRAILGLDVCYRDSGVAKYGLVNALLPIGTSFLEVLAPVGPTTAPGRFLEPSVGHCGQHELLRFTRAPGAVLQWDAKSIRHVHTFCGA